MKKPGFNNIDNVVAKRIKDSVLSDGEILVSGGAFEGNIDPLVESRIEAERAEIDSQLAQIGTLITLTRTNALSVPNGTTIALPFEVVGTRTSSNFADFYELTVEGNLLIKKSGVYSLSAALFFGIVPASQAFQDIAIISSGVTISFASHREFFLETNINIILSANDIVSVLTKQTTGSSINTLSSNFAPRLSVVFLGGN